MSREIDALLAQAVQDRVFPGAAWAVVGPDGVLGQGFVGRYTYDPESPQVDGITIFDLASVTKVMATTTSALLLHAQGGFELDQPVQSVLPEFEGDGKEAVTFRHLLSHNSGLIAHRDWWLMGDSVEARWNAVLREPLLNPPGKVTAYSCGGFLVLALALQRVTGEVYPDSWTWPAFRLLQGMGIEARFCPTEDQRLRCAPTEQQADGSFLQGVVHDENCRFLGGMTGNAGLFGTLSDVARFSQWCVNSSEGAVDEATWRQWTAKQAVADSTSTRALGWDTKSQRNSSAGEQFSDTSFGHTGFTGTSIWIDPTRKISALLLTNRVHPTRNGPEMLPIRAAFADHASKLFGSKR